MESPLTTSKSHLNSAAETIFVHVNHRHAILSQFNGILGAESEYYGEWRHEKNGVLHTFTGPSVAILPAYLNLVSIDAAVGEPADNFDIRLSGRS